MSGLQKVALGTPPTAVDGDTVRGANIKMNSNVDVLSTQATLTSNAATITAAQALTVAHLGKRVNVSLAAAGTINLPAASTCTADGVIHIRNIGGTFVTLAITAGSGDTLTQNLLAPGQSALLDTDGVHAWTCLLLGASQSVSETTSSFDYSPQTGNNAGYVTARPVGSGNVAGFQGYGSANKANASVISMYVSGANSIINTSKTGSGVTNPLDIYVDSVFNTRFFANGTVGINASTPGVAGAGVTNIWSATYQLVLRNTGSASGKCWLIGPNSANNIVVFNQSLTGVYVADGSTAWAGQSDERLKNIRSDITGAVDAIKDIRTVRYTWKSDDDHAEALGVQNDSQVYVGVIAQDVQKHVPEAVSVSHDEYLGVAYTDLVPLCMAAIKELSAKLDSAQAQITALQARAA